MLPVDEGVERVLHPIAARDLGHDGTADRTKRLVLARVGFRLFVWRARGTGGDPIAKLCNLRRRKRLPFVLRRHPLRRVGGRDPFQQQTPGDVTGLDCRAGIPPP